MKKEKRESQRSPFVWLLMMPAKLLLDSLFLAIGVFVEILLEKRDMARLAAEGRGGHPIFPFYFMIFLLIAIVATLIVVLVSVTITCVKLYLRRRERQRATAAWKAEEEAAREEERKAGRGAANWNGEEHE